MKGTICLTALALVLGWQSIGRGAEQAAAVADPSGWDLQPPYDRFSAPPPLGLRYTSSGIPYQFAGGGGPRPPVCNRNCPCGPCGAGAAGGNGGISAFCVDWALLPWYATWRFHHQQQGQDCGYPNWGYGY